MTAFELTCLLFVTLSFFAFLAMRRSALEWKTRVAVRDVTIHKLDRKLEREARKLRETAEVLAQLANESEENAERAQLAKLRANVAENERDEARAKLDGIRRWVSEQIDNITPENIT